MRRKREYFSIYLSPGVVLVFVSVFIGTISGGEIKENSGVKYDSGSKGVIVSAGESFDVNLNSKDAENLNFNMDTDDVVKSALQIWDFKDMVTFDVIQNKKVKVIFETTAEDGYIGAQLHAFGCHSNKKCPSLSHDYFHRGEQTYVLFTVHPGDQDHRIILCVAGLLAILTFLLVAAILFRRWREKKSTDCEKTRSLEEITEDQSTKDSQHQRTNSKDSCHQISAVSDQLKHDREPEFYHSTPNSKDSSDDVKMRESRQETYHSAAVYLALGTGLLCVVMLSAVVWFGRTGMRNSSEDLDVLKIRVPSQTNVRHIRSYSESPEISDVDLGQDRSLALLTRLQFLDLSSDCRHNLTLCRTHALCDATNPDAELQCRCNRGFYLNDLTCIPCRTSCTEGFYMTQQCGATNDVICKPCSVCSGTRYAAAQCTSTQDTICIDVTFPVRQFIDKLQTADEQLLLNYTLSDNVFLEQLYKIRQLQQPLYMKNNKARMDLLFERPSGLEVKVKVEDTYLIPEYVDIDHVDDVNYVMNHRGFPQDIKDQVEKVVEKYCRHPLPNEYDLHLSITRNISTAAAEITCDSKNPRLPACPSGYKDGDKYVYKFLDQPCRRLNMENFTEYFREVQEDRDTFREHSNNILCSNNPEILSKVFHVAVQDSDPLTFPSELCKNYAQDCQQCLSTSSCSGSHCCDDIDCYARTSCRNLYTSVCPGAPVQCTRGDVSKLSIVPRYSNIDKEFSCHLKHYPPQHLNIFNYTVSIPKMGFTFPKRRKYVQYYNISHQEEGTDSVDYLIASHHTNIPLRDEVMLIGTFGTAEDTGAEKVDYSLHRLKKSQEFDRELSFSIRRKSSVSLRTQVQFEKPFLYSTSTWKLDGCDKNVSQIIAPQPLYHTQGQPLEQMVRKKKDKKFVYELLTVGMSPHVKFTIPENVSILSYYKEELSGAQLNNQSLQGTMVWDRQTLYWNITITGSISSCPGYFTVEIYKGAPLIRLALYDMLITCPKKFILKFFITHHESVDIPDIFIVVLNDSVTSNRLVLSSVQSPQIFHGEKQDIAATEQPQGSPWVPIIVILTVCSFACLFLLILYAYCDNKQTKGIPLDIMMPKPDLGAQITLLQNMDIVKPSEKLSFQSKIVMATLIVLYIVYALSFTFLVLFGLLHLMQGPHIGDLAVGSNTSAKIHSKVESHLEAMINYESNQTTRLVKSTQQRLMACSDHLKTSLYNLIPKNSVAMRRSLRKVFEKNGTVHSMLREYFTRRLKEYQPQIKKFIDEFNQTLDRNLHQLHISYTTYLETIADNRWLEFPKQIFLEQERQEGRKFSAVDDDNRADFLTWLEIDKVQEMITIKDILMNRMLAMMPKVNFSELLEDLDSELDNGDRNFTLHENWIKFTSSNIDRSRLEALKKNKKNYSKGNVTTADQNSNSGNVSSIKSIIYPLFLGVFLILDGFLLVYRFSWMIKCLKMFKKGIDQRVPFDSITRKIHFILTGKDVPKVGENLEFPYDCALDALNKKENIWGDNIDKYFIYCQSSAKSREDILREIFKERQEEKPKLEKEVKPRKCCCLHFFIKGIQLLYRMFISPIFWRFTLICSFVLLLCLVTKATNDLVTMESAMFLLDTDAVWPVLARQEVVTNQVISQQGLYLNSFLDKYKEFVDTEIQILNSILIAGTKNQSHLLNTLISDLCNMTSDGLCTQSVAVDLVVPTLTSCNFLPVKPQMHSGFHRTIMSEYIKTELFPLVNSLRSILFSAFYLLLTFVSAMLICQICARVIFVYLQKSRHLRTTKIYQLSSCLYHEEQDYQVRDMYEGQSLVAESCESGVYDMTS